MILPCVHYHCIFLLYILVMGLLSLVLPRLQRPSGKEPSGKERVSVMMPFRNEAAHLPGLIDDLSRQSYPVELFLVILVNDHSTDGSGQIATSLVEAHPGFYLSGIFPGEAWEKGSPCHTPYPRTKTHG